MRNLVAIVALSALALTAQAAEKVQHPSAIADTPDVGVPLSGETMEVSLRGPGVIVYDAFPVPVGQTPDPTNVYNLFRSRSNPNRWVYPISLECGVAEGASAATPVTLTSMDIAVRTVGVSASAPISFDLLISFYDDVDVNIAPPGVAVTGQVGTTLRHVVTNYGGGGRYYGTVSLAGAGITLDDPNFGVECIAVTPGGGPTDNFPNTSGVLNNPAACPNIAGADRGPTMSMNADPPTVGSANGLIYCEKECEQAAPCGPLGDNIWMNCEALNFGNYCPFRIYAQAPLPPLLAPANPPASTCLGVIIDDDSTSGPLVINFPLAVGETRWFQMTITENIDGPPIATGEYLDIHTEGSDLIPAAGSVEDDTVLALYDNQTVLGSINGLLVAVNDDADPTNGSPNGHHKSLLSFGTDISRAYPVVNPPVGFAGPLLAAGQDGPLTKGIHYLAVSGFPQSAGACRWAYSSNSPDAGTMSVTISANLVNPCPGDLNGDKVVNESDLGILLGGWQAGACGDLNRDGQTAEADLGILLGVWQQSCGPN